MFRSVFLACTLKNELHPFTLTYGISSSIDRKRANFICFIPVCLQKSPDKGGGMVIMKRTAIDEKLKALISDQTKYSQSDKKLSGIMKNKINSITEK